MKIGALPVFAFAYLALAALASLQDPTPFWGQEKTIEILTWISFLLVCWLTPLRQKDLAQSLTIMEGFAIPLIAYGFIQHFGLDPFQWKGNEPRIFSFTGNPDFFADYLSILMSITLARYLDKPSIWRVLLLEGEATALFWSFTRGPLPGLIFSFVLCFALLATRRGWKKMIPRAGGMALLLAATFGFLLFQSRQTRLGERFSPSTLKRSHNVAARIYFMEKGMEVLEAHPFTGVGADNFGRSYLPFRNDEPAFYRSRSGVAESTHNAFLDAFVAAGFPGGLIFVAIWISAFWILLREARGASDEEAMMRLSLLAPLATAALALQFIFPDLSTQALLGFLLGGTGVFAKEEKLCQWPLQLRAGILAAALFACGFWAYHAARTFGGEWIGGAAQRAFNEKDYVAAAALFSGAAARNPWSPVLADRAGETYELTGNSAQALQFFSRAILKQNNNPYFWDDLEKLAGKNLWEKMAMEAGARAVSLDPFNSFFLRNAAYTAFRFGRFHLAVLYAQRAYSLNPGDPANAYFLAAGWLKTGQKQRAAPLIKKELREHPGDPGFLNLQKKLR